jgi:PiT family inorganic phosphate transporter
MGAAATNRVRAVNWKIAAEMLWAWVLTFPGCGAAGYLAARLFLRFL